MKKVAFFSEIMIEDFDGASRTMFQIINRIDQTSFSYLFIHGRGPQSIRNFPCHQVPTLRIPLNDDYSLALPQLSPWKLENKLDKFNPDVIHIATPSLLGFFALNYAKRKNIPVISIYHTHFISYIAYYFRNLSLLIKPTEHWTRQTMIRFYNHCEKVYVPTANMMDELKEIGIQAARLTLWQRGVDAKLFNPQKRDKAYLRSLTNNNRPTILFASRLVWEKNIQTLIAIYQQLELDNTEYNLIIAGDGAAKATAESQMPNAIFLGKVAHEELAKLYASADVFLFTSTSETYGNVVIEAMASGLPSVIANGGGSANLIQHYQTGFKCEANNAAEYVYFIHKIITNSTLREKIQQAALRYVNSLNWANLTDQYFHEVQALASTKQKAISWATN